MTYHSDYNIIHFIPIQSLNNILNSSYSIIDHLKLNSIFKGTHEQIKILVDKMLNEWKIVFITNLVYNHIANDCPLLDDHLEFAYNLIHSSHFKLVVLLDSI